MLNKIFTWFNQSLLHYSSFGAYFEPVIQLFKPNWREGYYRAQVKSVDFLLADTLAITLQVGSSWPVHKAGQHLELTLEIGGRLVTRVFTVASSPAEARARQQLRLVIKVQQNGVQTPKLSELSVSDWVNISAPYGDFCVEEFDQQSVFLAAGSGITPFISMLTELKSKPNKTPPIHLIYYAKPGEHLLTHELAELSASLTFFSYVLKTRTADGDVAQQLAGFERHSLFVCGPTAFYQSVARFADEHNNTLHAEHFSLAPIKNTNHHAFEVLLNGKGLSVDDLTPILTQLLQQGEQVKHGCKMGICHQCQCIKKRGVVKNLRTGKLSDRGEELIQLCVSQILTDLELES